MEPILKMINTIIESLAPTKKQKILYSLLGTLLVGLIPPTPSWVPVVSISSLFPTLDTDKATILLSLLTILLSYSLFLLRREKEKEIKDLNEKLNECKNHLKMVIVENASLTQQIEFKSIKEYAKAKTEDLSKIPNIKL